MGLKVDELCMSLRATCFMPCPFTSEANAFTGPLGIGLSRVKKGPSPQSSFYFSGKKMMKKRKRVTAPFTLLVLVFRSEYL
jgi:hypothetical protein